MHIEIINTGTELMLGRVLNSHQHWLCRRLADLGYVVTRQVAIADEGAAIQNAVREALQRADVIITTGGLGPTSDDLTRDLIADLLDLRLFLHAPTMTALEAFFAVRNRPMPEHNRVQAMVPEGASVLGNPNGTAPGLAIELRPNPFREGGNRSVLFMLPGPPRELRPMFDDAVVPLLHQHFPIASGFVCRTLRTTGVGESFLQEQIAARLQPLMTAGLDLGYCARTQQVDIRLAARGPQAETLVCQAEAIVRAEVGAHIYGRDDEEIEAVVVRLLTGCKQTLALAESCTGGAIAHRITNVPGASVVLRAGVVAYGNKAKQDFLGVHAETLARCGAVSDAVVREMAVGARSLTGADYAIAVTGIAGPGGGSEEKPVGTVWIALADARGVEARQFFNPYDRETFKSATSQQALEWLRHSIAGGASPEGASRHPHRS